MKKRFYLSGKARRVTLCKSRKRTSGRWYDRGAWTWSVDGVSDEGKRALAGTFHCWLLWSSSIWEMCEWRSEW